MIELDYATIADKWFEQKINDPKPEQLELFLQDQIKETLDANNSNIKSLAASHKKLEEKVDKLRRLIGYITFEIL